MWFSSSIFEIGFLINYFVLIVCVPDVETRRDVSLRRAYVQCVYT